jgi:ABC-type branched-subunit amino acid transport system ATPase component
METLRCCNLSKSFDGVHALVELDLDFPSGITSIIGPNGAGKTTLINILTGFLRPDTGRCLLGTREITRLSPFSIARLGIARTFQDLRLIQKVPALENVMLARPRQRGESLIGALLRVGIAREEFQNRDEATKLLRFVGLQEKADDLVSELSYGQQKLLTLATCLATEARILLLDEPVAGVQPEMARNILDLMRALAHNGKQVVFIEHDITAVRQVADHVIVIDHGKIRAQGAAEEVLERPDILEAYLG